jgi:general secretion pathway protein J
MIKKVSHRAEREHANAGFTLIELVVALALAGVISLLLLQGISLATTGLDRISRMADQLDERRGVDIVVRRTLASASAAPAPDGEPSFIGTPTRLSFLSLAEDNGPGLVRIEIRLDPAGNDRSLLFVRHPAASTSEPYVERSLLVPRIREFRMAYFGADSITAEPAWHDRWEGIAYLPKLVRLIIDRSDGPTRASIVVRLWNAG